MLSTRWQPFCSSLNVLNKFVICGIPLVDLEVSASHQLQRSIQQMSCRLMLMQLCCQQMPLFPILEVTTETRLGDAGWQPQVHVQQLRRDTENHVREIHDVLFSNIFIEEGKVWALDHSRQTRSLSLLMMTWLLLLADHQQPWCWLWEIRIFLPALRVSLKFVNL